MLDITLDIPELDALIGGLARWPAIYEDEVRRAMERSVTIAETEVVDRTPVDLGHLRNSISSRVEGAGGELQGVIEVANVPYAPFVENDTQPHEIRPRNRQALAFQMAVGARVGSRRAVYRIQRGARAGRVTTRASAQTLIFARRVWHPGTQGAHMFRDGAVAAWPQVQAEFAAALRRASRRVAGR